MRGLVFLLALAFATPAFAQSRYFNGGHVATSSAPTVNLPCIDPTQSPYNADPTGTADSTPAFQSAINAAQALVPTRTTVGKLCIPGGTYKVTAPLTITSGDITIEGAGANTTVFLPTQNDDVFYAALPTPAASIFGINFRGFRIYRADNPTAGAGIHYIGANQSQVLDVRMGGEFYGIWCETCAHVHVTDFEFIGNNSTSGSAGLVFTKAAYAGAGDNYEDFLTNINVRGQTSHTGISYPLYIADADGVTLANCHLGMAAGPAVYLHAQNADPIDNVAVPCVLDSSQYGVYIDQAGGYTGNFGELDFRGAQAYDATNDGFYVDSTATSLDTVFASNFRFLKNAKRGLNLNAGKRYQFAASQFSGNNQGNGGYPDVNLAGTTLSVNLQGSQFNKSSGAHAVTYNIITAGSADHLYGSFLDFNDAASGTISAGTSGSHVSLTAAP